MKKTMSVQKLALLGMMAALVFAGNFARITMPLAIAGQTSFTLANIICCLSGLILGPVGGLAAGLGSALFDFTDPRFAAEFWITFINKGLMGLVVGLAAQRGLKAGELTYRRATAASVLGCVVYYILYFTKSFFYSGILVQGLEPAVAAATLPLKIPASVFNGAVAIIAAPPLALAIWKALRRSGLEVKS